MLKQLRKIFVKIVRSINPDAPELIRDWLLYRSLKRSKDDLKWSPCQPSYAKRLDAGGAQIGHVLYVIGGFLNGSNVADTIDAFDMHTCAWTRQWKIPTDMAQTHLGVVSDGQRYIYCIAGQYGAQCRPPIARNFVFDVEKGQWNSLPDLPFARYAPAVALWNGRIHVIAGSKEDRYTPAHDHWSIAVKDGKAIETAWRTEAPIPRGGVHRAASVLNDKLYVFGGQEGDYIPRPGDPQFTCVGDLVTETVYPDVYMLSSLNSSWERVANMPVQASHIEFSKYDFDHTTIFVGGMKFKDPQTHIIELTDAIQVYNAETNSWKIIGRSPYRIKSSVVGYYRGQIFMTTGQKDYSEEDPRPHDFDARVWRCRLKIPELQ